MLFPALHLSPVASLRRTDQRSSYTTRALETVIGVNWALKLGYCSQIRRTATMFTSLGSLEVSRGEIYITFFTPTSNNPNVACVDFVGERLTSDNIPLSPSAAKHTVKRRII